MLGAWEERRYEMPELAGRRYLPRAESLAETNSEMLNTNTDRSLILFTKPARAGEVKTRLIGDLDAVQAAELHAAFRDDLIERLEGGKFELRIAWALASEEEIPEHRIAGERQQGADLGQRLHQSLAAAAGQAAVVAAVGSDHPLLPLTLVEDAFDRLERGAEIVLGPATDGGYYLIAVRREHLAARLFEDIPWSTDRVLERTLDRCRELELGVELLEEASDVDTPADLETLVEALAASGGVDSSRTRRLLEGWGRLHKEVRG